MATESTGTGFDRGAAVTRSLLGYGVLVGPFYLVVGLVHALLREGFDVTRHPLSLLTLGGTGWIQITNLVLSGLMVCVAALGVRRALGTARGARATALLLTVYGVCVLLSGVFVPDPMAGFPVGATAPETPGVSGIAHLVMGAVGFLALAGAAVAGAVWARATERRGPAIGSIAAAVLIAGGFIVGAALAMVPGGVAGLWLAVLTGWTWLALFSVTVYRTVPHPDAHRRAPAS
ncbi:DUF998 domain-containing protein [Nocardiopsis sp. N85]|uniref:DUF998 domain-containing protein n=1 Tax=Nocardiopsis sp. N85 TaxID=3029400 RepID=UPI00237F5438|nr:DUF998 domain-containing protein [Nocardiopsis sp. N85]MDE3725109.1 DUF998 domain-containing protein [Nocardiopsis sp. N85]